MNAITTLVQGYIVVKRDHVEEEHRSEKISGNGIRKESHVFSVPPT